METAARDAEQVGTSSANPHAEKRRGRFAKLQALASRPTAILCSNDMTAIGVLRAATWSHARAPGPVGHPASTTSTSRSFHLPPLTTIRLSRIDLARAAFEALRQQAEDPHNPSMQREFLVSTAWCCADRPPAFFQLASQI